MKNKLNYELLEFHIREATGVLDSLLSRIQFMLGRPNKAGELYVAAWGDLNEASLEVSLAHAYHHMNTAWNARNKATNEVALTGSDSAYLRCRLSFGSGTAAPVAPRRYSCLQVSYLRPCFAANWRSVIRHPALMIAFQPEASE